MGWLRGKKSSGDRRGRESGEGGSSDEERFGISLRIWGGGGSRSRVVGKSKDAIGDATGRREGESARGRGEGD